MANSRQGGTPAGESALPIREALDKNKEATAEVKKAADDLAVVHAVLETKLGDKDKKGIDADVSRAVAETHKVEKQLVQSAEKLESVNHALERQGKRAS